MIFEALIFHVKGGKKTLLNEKIQEFLKYFNADRCSCLI